MKSKQTKKTNNEIYQERYNELVKGFIEYKYGKNTSKTTLNEEEEREMIIQISTLYHYSVILDDAILGRMTRDKLSKVEIGQKLIFYAENDKRYPVETALKNILEYVSMLFENRTKKDLKVFKESLEILKKHGREQDGMEIIQKYQTMSDEEKMSEAEADCDALLENASVKV